MPVMDLPSWMDHFAKEGTVWIAKRLTGNDTLANKTHQYGPYIPKEFLFEIIPSINDRSTKNPDKKIDLYLDSHADHRLARVIWYNDTYHVNPKKQKKGSRNETRITRLGGKQSALLDPDSTGAIAVFVFVLDARGLAAECHVWVCDDKVQEDLIEDRIGPVEPKAFVTWKPGAGTLPLFAALPAEPAKTTNPCWLTPDKIPPEWLRVFPSGATIIQKTRELQPDHGLSVDERIVRRRACEWQLFQSVEEAVYLPRMKHGFTSIANFVSLAQTILQSRKSRAGNSLEFHTRDILIEEKFLADKDFSFRPVVEGNKRPDFLFPSAIAYKDNSFPAGRLRMLAVKTTCKDRWRQVLSEASRIKKKHLLTEQEGMSDNQFKEIVDENVQLVVPDTVQASYSKHIRPYLITLESFLAEVRLEAFAP